MRQGLWWRGGDDGTSGDWIPSLHLNGRVLFRIWVKILPLGILMYLVGTGRILVPYKGYFQASLVIQSLPCYDEDVLLLGILDYKYGPWS